jgi:hypothetical protein
LLERFTSPPWRRVQELKGASRLAFACFPHGGKTTTFESHAAG